MLNIWFAGQYRYQFTETGTYYIWSGYVDQWGIKHYAGTINVASASSYAAEVSVRVSGVEALYNVGGRVFYLSFFMNFLLNIYFSTSNLTTSIFVYIWSKYNTYFVGKILGPSLSLWHNKYGRFWDIELKTSLVPFSHLFKFKMVLLFYNCYFIL